MILDAGRVVLDAANDRVVVDGEPVRLRGKPLNVLRELMARHDQLVTKEDLLESVWEGRPHSDAVLTTAIKEIRQALGDNPRSPWAIETVHRRGYRFLLPVSVTERAAAQAAEAAPLAESTPLAESARTAGAVDIEVPVPDATPRPRVPRWILPVAIVLLVVVGGRLLFRPSAADTVESVAVLPFNDMTSGGDHRWFADGLVEEMLNSLARIEGLQVAARTSAERFAGGATDIRDIGDALGVSHVIEGSVRNSADGEMRLTVQLIRSRDGFHQWSSTWDRNFSQASALAIQKDVSDRVAGLMKGQPPPPADAEAAAPLPEAAWELVVRGRTLVERRTADGIAAGINLLYEALEIAPQHATVHAALASAYLLAADSGLRAPGDAFTTARYHAGQALELDPKSVESLVASSFLALAGRNLDEALAYVDAAIAISPGHARAHQRRGVVLIMLGASEEAFEAFRVARRLDPLSPVVLANYSQLAMITGRTDEAFEAARDNLRWNPQNHTARYMMGSLSLEAGNYERALVCLRTALEASPAHGQTVGNLGEVYWRIGADERALAVAKGAAGWATRAAVSLSRGDVEGALADPDRPPLSGPSHLTPLDIYYWAGETGEAAAWAERFAETVTDLGSMATVGSLPDDAMAALVVMKSNDDPRAAELRDALAFRFRERGPEDARTLGDLLTGAAWHARAGDRDAAIAWLERATELGFVMRELDLDPSFEALRSDPDVLALRSLMEERAAEVRSGIDSADQC